MAYSILLSSILLYLAFPNYLTLWGLPSLAWLFGMPLFWLLHEQALKSRILISTAVGFLFFCGFVSWMASYNIFGYIGFVLILSTQFTLFGLLSKSNFHHTLLDLFYVPAAWVAAEYLHRFVMGGFSWNVGYSQAFNPPLIQIASWTGSHGVSFIIILVGYSLFKMTQDYRKRYFFLSIILIVPIAFYGYGFIVLKTKKPSSEQTINAALLQPNISSTDRHNPNAVGQILQRHIDLSGQLLHNEQIDLLIWPETAVTDDIFQEAYLKNFYRFLKPSRTNILLGSALLKGKKDYNSAILFNLQGRAAGIYDKMHVVPFAEYVPDNALSKLFAKRLRRNKFDFRPGKTLGLFEIDQAPFGITICSEDHYPDLFRKLKKNGAQFGVVILNDGWFPQDGALMIHAQASVMRAVENAMPILRTANTGLTAHILANGEVEFEHAPPLNKTGHVIAKIAPNHTETFYSKYGDIFALMCVCFVIINFSHLIYSRKVS